MTRIQNQTGPEEEFSDGAVRANLPGQTAAAAQRVVRSAPAQPLPGLPAASRGSVLAQAGATLGIALSGINRNKARTTLTLLGIVIGVASVITAVGIGTGQAAQVNAQISSLGTNLVTVQPGASFSGGVRGGVGSANTLTQSDVDALAAQIGPGGGLPDVASIAPEDTTSVQAVVGTNNTATQADGVTPEILTARTYQVAVGRFISANDVQRSAQVAVLGATLAGELFPGGLANAVGATIQLNGQAYQVIGVLALKGGFGNTDTNVFVPITAVQNRLSLRSGAANTVTAINLVATGADKTDAAQAEVEALLRRLHKLTPAQQDDFSFFSQTSVQQTASNVTGALTVLLSAIAAVSLLVAGIGIMNIMLVTVTERTREIGLRKALGARKGDILAQFLTESTLISVLGGLIGVLLSYGLAWALPLLTTNATQPLISGSVVAMAVGVSLVIGLFFGSYPASRAAALDPIQALRYE
jgi:putative ABC transport system permease protein